MVSHDFGREVRRRRDQSLYVTHFTKEVAGLTPGQVLRRILRARCIRAAPVGDRCAGQGRDADAVCFTEAPLLGLIVPTATRSPAHGIGFDKRFVYARGGGHDQPQQRRLGEADRVRVAALPRAMIAHGPGSRRLRGDGLSS